MARFAFVLFLSWLVLSSVVLRPAVLLNVFRFFLIAALLSLAVPKLFAGTNPEHEQFVPYWTLEPGWHSEFQLRNNLLGRDLTVTPFLRTNDGSEIALDPIIIPQDQVRMIDFRAAVKAQAPQLIDAANAFGSVVFRYQSPGAGNLGQGCVLGNEVVGTISPSVYTETITLHRWILNYTEYTNSIQTGSGSNEDDTSDAAHRDDNPQSGGSSGKVYDLDSPGKVALPVDNNTYRLRGNFYAYAALPDGTRISPFYNYYVRVSCKRTASGYQFANDVPGDNTIAAGTTLNTWNLQ